MLPFFVCFTILYIEKGEIILKKLSLVFAGLLITFFVSWGIKVKMPVNRPDNTETASTVKWYETKYTAPVADDEWILDPEIPDNYVPVAGENEVYMVLDDSGNITGYRQRTQQEDGSWLWADVKNPNASYESVDGLKQVYKVTDKKGNVSYEQYVRNEDGSYAYVPVNKKGIPLDDGSDASTIDNNHYVHASGNVYGLYNDNGVLIGYRERVKNNGNYIWKVTDKPKAGASDIQDLSEVKNSQKQEETKNENDTSGVIVGNSGSKSEKTDNGDGTYTQTNKTVNTKTEDGYQITYETIVTSVYDTDGNLLSTKKEGPYEVSKEKISSSEDPSKVTIAGSLDEEYARVSTSVTYDTKKASELLAKINAERTAAGVGQLSMDTSSAVYKLACIKAADMATYDYSSDSSPLYGSLNELVTRFGADASSASENIWKVSVKSADEINTRFQSNEGSRQLRMADSYTSVGIAIVEKNGQDYIVELFL